MKLKVPVKPGPFYINRNLSNFLKFSLSAMLAFNLLASFGTGRREWLRRPPFGRALVELIASCPVVV